MLIELENPRLGPAPQCSGHEDPTAAVENLDLPIMTLSVTGSLVLDPLFLTLILNLHQRLSFNL